jgi:predicted CXXCH cytochrome family protein
MRCPRLAFILIPALAILCLQSLLAKEKSQYWMGSFAKYVQIAGATRVGSDTCVSCHADVAGNFRHAFHAQQGVECEDCHGPGSLHVDGKGDVTKIIRFSARPPDAANGVCLSCHVQDAPVRSWMAGTHAAEHVRCTECHQTHTRAPQAGALARLAFDTTTPGSITFAERLQPESTVKMAPREQINESCLKCHQSQRAEMSLPYHHPLQEGKVTCVDCHNPHGGPAGKNLRVANVNQLCLSCHAQYRGPYMYQHPPVNESCLICHSPHGSPNVGMLSVSQPALCLQCHAGHHDGASLPLADRCTNCHASIHGTDVPTPSGGSRFVDKGGVGVPREPAAATAMRQSRPWASVPLVPAHARAVPRSSPMVVAPSLGPLSSQYQPGLVPSHTKESPAAAR